MSKLVLITLLVLIGLVCLGGYFMYQRAQQSQQMTPELGLEYGALKPCPSSPNCVCSVAGDESHSIPSISGGKAEFDALAAYIASADNAEIRVLSEDYLWATYKTSFFGFVDDLELHLQGSEIHVRSASREGYSDLGTNRKRVENLRMQLDNGQIL